MKRSVFMPSTTPPSSSQPPALTKNRKKVAGRIFGGITLSLTAGFGYVLADYFYFEPTRNAGIPVYGTRLDELTPLDESLLTRLTTEANQLEGVQTAQIQPQGQVIYLSLTTENLSLKKAQTIAESLATQLVDGHSEELEGYTIQLMVTTSDGETLLETNREAEEAYVKEHKVNLIETIIAHTEKYPTAKNIQRSKANIEILKKKYPEEAEAFAKRIAILKEYTAEEEAQLDIPVLTVDQTVPTSDLADFPSWGSFNPSTLKATWF